MEILQLQYDDFVLSIESTNFLSRWNKAVGNLQEDCLVSTYKWTEGEKKHFLLLSGDLSEEIANGTNGKAFFFENTDYSIWVDFESRLKVKAVQILTEVKDIESQFKFHPSKNIFAGFINYKNDIGMADLCFRYQLESGEWKQFCFSYEVLSTKLDYHSDWKTILSDIENEYHMLAWDYLRQTYHNIGETEGVPNSLTWWSVFRQQQQAYTNACRAILNKPRHRLRPEVNYLRADKIKRMTPQLEQEFAEHKQQADFLYRVEEQVTSHDTIENRFLKFTLRYITDKFTEVSQELLNWNSKNISDTLREEIEETKAELRTLTHNPFFRTVGAFKGFKQESLILLRDPYYATIYRTYQILRKSFSLQEGLFNLQTKDIATLYEIWCLIQVSHIVSEKLGDKVTFTQQNRPELHPLFVSDLKQGQQSAIVYKNGDVELAKVVYNPKHTGDEEGNGLRGIGNLTSRTVNQKPDIVLQLTKDDMIDGLKLTYLFDAKYRIKGNEDGSDVPPDDAINQMHRYRDAIYYAASNDHDLKKEIIGGYILFPGKVQAQSAMDTSKKSHFFASVDEVGIGAFPLRPDKQGKEFLELFIEEILKRPAAYSLKPTIPQKGLRYEKELTKDEKEHVLIGFYKDDAALAWFNKNNRYVIRAGEGETGAIEANDKFFNIQYIVLVGRDRKRVGIYKTRRKSPMIATKETLAKQGYQAEHEAYYSYQLQAYDPNLLSELDHTKAKEGIEGKAYYHPEVITLAEYKHRTKKI